MIRTAYAQGYALEICGDTTPAARLAPVPWQGMAATVAP
jgi:hypothetical protein